VPCRDGTTWTCHHMGFWETLLWRLPDEVLSRMYQVDAAPRHILMQILQDRVQKRIGTMQIWTHLVPLS
jgi:hypothetical protein